jgi:hypothetical protein
MPRQLDEITFKHTRERRLLEDDLDRERQTVSALKVRTACADCWVLCSHSRRHHWASSRPHS